MSSSSSHDSSNEGMHESSSVSISSNSNVHTSSINTINGNGIVMAMKETPLGLRKLEIAQAQAQAIINGNHE